MTPFDESITPLPNTLTNSDYVLAMIAKEQKQFGHRISSFELEIKNNLNNHEDKIEKVFAELVKVSNETQRSIYQLQNELNTKITDVRHLNQSVSSDVIHLKKTEDKLEVLRDKVSKLDKTIDNYSDELQVIEKNESGLNTLERQVNDLRNRVDNQSIIISKIELIEKKIDNNTKQAFKNERELNAIAEAKKKRESEFSQIKIGIIVAAFIPISLGIITFYNNIQKEKIIAEQNQELIESKKELQKNSDDILLLLQQLHDRN